MAFEWSDRRILVTGATGFLGSWLVKELVRRKANVVGLIRKNPLSSEPALPGDMGNIDVVYGQLEDYFSVERCLNEYEIDTVFHLGAQTIVETATKFPLATFDSNVMGAWNLLEACRHHEHVKRIIVASSDKAYKDTGKTPYTEEAPIGGANIYSASKSCSDILCRSYSKTYGLPVAIARCSNLYGGGDLNFERIVPGTIKSVIENKSPIIKGDGTNTRDYLYVMDAVNAYLALAEQADKDGAKGQDFNFSTGEPTSVSEIVHLILEISGNNRIKPIAKNAVEGEVKKQFLDPSKAKKILGWGCKYRLKDGLSETFKWYRDFFNQTKLADLGR